MFSKAFVFAMAMAPTAFAHIGLWYPSAFGFNGDGYTLVTPMSNLSFSEWWFHGNLDEKPSPATPPMELPAGGTVTVELACNKQFTSYGDNSDGQNACPTDTPSFHAGVPVLQENVLGCGLAIAYKSNADEVLQGDFTIFSVNHDCVRGDLNVPFEVPAAMPACPGGKCTCAWFWQGQTSFDEMYMTGFECNVSGATSTTAIGTPAVPVWCPDGGCVTGPKQPMYWANESPNVDFSGDYTQKPSYNARWGFANGAQNDIFVGGNVPAGGEEEEEGGDGTTPTTVVATPTTLVTMTRAPATTTAISCAGTNVPVTCEWEGHCRGASCSTNDDCSDVLTCNSGICG